MEFNYSEEQEMLADAARRFVERNCTMQARRSAADLPEGFDRRAWEVLAELGMTALPAPGSAGGLDGSAADVMIVATELGRGLAPEPFISSCVVAAALVAGSDAEEGKQGLLPAIARGTAIVALADAEPGERYERTATATRAMRTGIGWTLQGRKSLVLDGVAATHFLVTASEGGTGPASLVFAIPRDAVGLQVHGFTTIDGRRVAELELREVPAAPGQLLVSGNRAPVLVRDAIERGIAAICAEAVGAMDRLCAITADYLRTRKQFKQPLATFQALQHRYADMMIALEQARSAAFMAAAALDETDPRQRTQTISAAKFLAGRSARFIGEQAVQLHGGIGMTAELEVGDFFKRLSAIDLAWGHTDHHLAAYANSL